MSQIIKLTPSGGAGTGTVTSISAGTGITLTPNPITTTGTVALTVPVVIANGGTNAIAMTNTFGVNYFDGTRIVTTTVGTAAQVLTSNGVGVAPTFQALPGGGVTSIAGNSGGAQTGAISLVTANASVTFVGAAGTITLDFNKSNLILGNSGSTITTGSANDGFGAGVLQNISSGTSNSAFGNGALLNVNTGSQNTAYGANAGQSLNTGGNNTFIGYQGGANFGIAASNNIAIGNVAGFGDSGRIRIGTNATHTTTFIAGIDGVNVGSVAKVLTMASDQLGTAAITAGVGISVTPGANTITIAATGSGSFTWSVITANQTAAVNNGYFANKAGTLALLLPAASAVGDTIEVTNENTALGVQFTQAAGQQILIGNTNTTLGAGGTLTSSAVGDTLKIVCYIANTIWRVTSVVGNWTVV